MINFKAMFTRDQSPVLTFKKTAEIPNGLELTHFNKMINECERYLQCPHCGGEHMQQETLNSFQRMEGQKRGVFTSFAQGKVRKIRRYQEGLFKDRVGVDLVYKCEGCSNYSILSNRHEKGRNTIHMKPCELLS